MLILSSIVMEAKTYEQLHCHSKLPFSASIYFKANLPNTELCQYFTFYFFFLRTKVTCQLNGNSNLKYFADKAFKALETGLI